MLKRLRNLRLTLLFVNYLICMYALGIFGFFDGMQIEGIYKTLVVVAVSVLIALSGLILTYFGKNCNIIYCVTYILMIVPLFIYNIDLKQAYSDYLLFCILLVVIMITIFCWYLYLWEKKIERVLEKGASESDIQKCYSKYLTMYTGFIIIVASCIVGLYAYIQDLSSRFVMYLYYIGAIFSVPAILGLVGIVLVCIFLFVMLYERNDDKK